MSMSTKELIDSFLESQDGKCYAKRRKNFRENQLYDYEKKIGKNLIDMNENELMEFLRNLNISGDNSSSKVVTSSLFIDQVVSIYRKIFDYYTNNFTPIRNPLRNKMFSGNNLFVNVSKGKEILSWNIVNSVIQKIHKDYSPELADYIELIILLYYNGFANATEIIEMQPKDVCHKNKSVIFPDKTVYLSDRCYTLLTGINEKDAPCWNGLIWERWRGSYFKFPIKSRKTDLLADRPLESMRETINAYFSKYINSKYDARINYSSLYCLGFYDYIVKKFGEEETSKMLLSNYNLDYVAKLKQAAEEYGFKTKNISHLKRRLRIFVTKTD